MNVAKICRILVILMASIALGCSQGESTASGWTWRPSKSTWKVYGDLLGPANISAIASVDGQSFILGSDDLTVAQFGAIDSKKRKLVLKGQVPLYKSKDRDEIDIEGIAAAPEEATYYITGSHSVTKKGNMNKERRSVFRVTVDHKTGHWNKISRKSLLDLIRDNATLSPHWEQSLQQDGINIEGLAWKAGQLYFGFRSPNLKEHALVLQVPTQGLFEKGKDEHTLHRVPLGRGLGIRELVAIREGFLLVAGNAGDSPTAEQPKSPNYLKGRPYGIYFWDPITNIVQRLATFARPGRPEAMVVLTDTKNTTEVLVLFDGVRGGAPTAYTLTKR
jgi:hypothetical protein